MQRVHTMAKDCLGPTPAAVAQALTGRLPVASPWRGSLEGMGGEAGPAWRDAAFLTELRERNERLGVGEPTRTALESLAKGKADCVIAGQQPGLLGGPILLATKLACAIGLAQRLSEAHGRLVVPVFWCGADDSDFEETTRAWLWSGQGPFRVRLEDRSWQGGQRVGGIANDRIAELEANALAHGAVVPSWDWRSDLEKLLQARDFGERMAAWAELCFGHIGLVVVDARSQRLRELGGELFERYRLGHREWTEQLLVHTERLRSSGVPLQLHPDALASGLFRLDGERRIKLRPDELTTAPARSLAASVLLRPLWQDALLAPRAAILGPAELAYHAQLTPLYAALGVRAAVALPRAQLWTLPESVLAADPTLTQEARLCRDADAWLLEHAPVAAQLEALAKYEAAMARALSDLRANLPQLDEASLQASAERQRAHAARLRESLLPMALASRGADWQHLPAWCAIGGEAQERVYALAALWQRFGRLECRLMLHELGEAYVRSLAKAELPHFLAALSGGQ